MSEEETGTENPSPSDKVVKHKIEVSTSDREKELGKAKDELLTEKAKLEKELADIKTNYEKKVDELKKATEDVDDIAKQRDDLASKYTAIAMKRFEEERKALLDRAKTVVGDELLKDMEEKTKTPEEFDKMKWHVESLLSQLEKAKGSPVEKTPPNPEKKGSGGSGSVEITTPELNENSEIKKKQFNSPKEMIDYLYDRIARGQTVSREIINKDGGKTLVEERVGPDEEAENVIKELWKRYFQSEKNLSAGRSTWVMCWKCKGMFDAGLGTCPLCKVPLQKGPDVDKYGIKAVR